MHQVQEATNCAHTHMNINLGVFAIINNFLLNKILMAKAFMWLLTLYLF